MNSLERVRKCIHMQGPDRIPIIFINKDFEKSDMLMLEVIEHFRGGKRDTSEFGFTWERHDDTMGQPKDCLIHEWSEFESVKWPNPCCESRFVQAQARMVQYPGKYYVASLALSGFTLMTLLRGFENTLMDIYSDDEHIVQLADKVFSFEEGIIGQAKSKGFHAVAFFDDWGTQNSLIISPEQWRQFFKARYRKQFDFCHENGLDVYFHCCGYVWDIIEDFIEIGVDILNISQPNLFDIQKLGKAFGGRVCFLCPISYQTTALSGSREDIFADAKTLIDSLGCFNGGFIGYVEEYSSIGLSDENYQNCIDAFTTITSKSKK